METNNATAYTLELDELHLLVELTPQGWEYRIWRRDNHESVGAAVCPKEDVDRDRYVCMLEAIKSALAYLARVDDPNEVLANAEWRAGYPQRRAA